jgi:hypothetical protein
MRVIKSTAGHRRSRDPNNNHQPTSAPTAAQLSSKSSSSIIIVMATTTTAAAAAISNVDAHLEVTPENEICFTLRKADTSPRVTLTLKHPDPDSSPVAFKVRLFFIYRCGVFSSCFSATVGRSIVTRSPVVASFFAFLFGG